MKSAPFTYYDPTSVPELVDLLANAEDAKILAGGQSLMPMMNMRFLMPDDVIYINGVHELNFIERENGHLKFGAMTRQKEVLGSSTVTNAAPIFGEALRYVGHIQTRTRGTASAAGPAGVSYPRRARLVLGVRVRLSTGKQAQVLLTQRRVPIAVQRQGPQ